MSEECYFCDETDRLETHHIVPQRYDGLDTDENTVTVCPTCHSKLENLYDRRFYDTLGVDHNPGRDRPSCELCGEPADGQVRVGARLESMFLCESCADPRGFMMEF